MLSAEDLSRYLRKIELVGLGKVYC